MGMEHSVPLDHPMLEKYRSLLETVKHAVPSMRVEAFDYGRRILIAYTTPPSIVVIEGKEVSCWQEQTCHIRVDGYDLAVSPEQAIQRLSQ